MQVLRSTTLVLMRGLVGGSAMTTSPEAAEEIAGVAVVALPDRFNAHSTPGVQPQTVSEAKEVWRYEGNPN